MSEQSDIDPKWMQVLRPAMPDEGTDLLEQLMRFRPEGLTANAWAVKAGVSRTVWNDLRRHGNPSRRTLEKLLAAADSSLAEFEALRVDGPAPSAGEAGTGLSEAARPWRTPPLAPLPVVACFPAGEWGAAGNAIELVRIARKEVADRMPRPAGLAGDADAYAITVIGDAMWPRFRPGRRLAVSPAAPIAIGDDVLVLLAAPHGSQGGNALVKELVRRSASLVGLRQFNPDLTFAVPAIEISAVHKVVGEMF